MERKRIMQHLTGSPEFVEELKKRTFKSAEGVLHHVPNENFTCDYLNQNGFNYPIMFLTPDGLNMSTPKFHGWANLEQYIEGDRMVEVIDVEKQDYCLISFSTMMKYMKKPSRSRILNLISLECSDTSLGSLIEPPAVATQLDWVYKYWTSKRLGSDIIHCKDMPRIQKYCLVSPKNAYTDFHIDFGGTSVWYHVVKGAKTFYIIRPSSDNMNLYTNWLDSSSRLRTFFADQVDDCYKVTLLPGNTLFLPTGWIHAVLTVEDSLVFGGNFLHSLNIEGQLRVYAMETRTKTPERLMYPNFEEMHWRAARGLTKDLEDFNAKNLQAPSYLLLGLKALLANLKQWSSSSRSYVLVKEKHIIIKNLSKSIKIAERILLLINPPKPERGSTRPRKKRILEDFVDYPTSSSRKKIYRKPKESIDSSGENWHVHNGGTKVVFRKLKGLPSQHESSLSGMFVNSDKDPQSDSNFKNKEYDIISISSDSEQSSDATWVLDQPSSSSGYHTAGKYRAHFQFPNTDFLNNTTGNHGLMVDSSSVGRSRDDAVIANSESSKPVVVHQDDDYIYPSLLMSDEENLGCRMTSKEKDAPWSPKAKVGNVVPKTDRPARIGKQKVAVGKGLEEAASVIDTNTPSPKDVRKKNLGRNVGLKEFIPNPASPVSRPSKKGRKRSSTVKQRLSKILKLHRKQR